MKGHDKQRIRVGLDRHTTVSCECGQAWDLGENVDPYTTGIAVATRHATVPNVGDPRRAPNTDVPHDEISRGPIIGAWLREGAPRTPPRGSYPPTPSPSHGPADRRQEQATDGQVRRVRT